MFQKPAVSDPRRIGRRSGDKKTGESIKKSETQHVSAQKPPARTQHNGSRKPSFFCLKLPLQENVREIIYFLHVAVDCWIRVVMEVAAQFFGGPVQFDFVMFRAASPSAFASSEQAQGIIGI